MDNSLTPFAELSKVIQMRRIKAIRKRDSRGYALNTLGTIFMMAIAVVVFLWNFQFRTVVGNDMFPALNDGDLVLCNQKAEYHKNDIVFYRAEGATYVGRVVAKGGDVVRITDSGNLIVNGTTQNGEIIYPTYPMGDEDIEVEVPEGTVYVLGDFRTQALDSRSFGCIPLSEVDYKIIALLRHRKF